MAAQQPRADPGGRTRFPRALASVSPSLLRQMTLVFLAAYLLIAPAIYLVYLDQSRAYRTTADAFAADATGTVAGQLALAVADQRLALDAYLATGSAAAAARAAGDGAAIAASRAELVDDAATAGLAGRLAGVWRSLDAWLAWAAVRTSQLGAGAGPGTAEPDREGPLFDAVRADIAVLGEAAAARSAALRQVSEQQQDQGIRDNVVSTVVVVIIVSIMVALVLGRTLRRVGRLASMATRLAAGEELQIPYTGSHGEVGQVARALAAWRTAEAANRAILEHTPIGLFSIDLESGTPTMNPTCRRLTGYTPEQLPLTDLTRLLFRPGDTPEQAAERMARYQQLLSGEIPVMTLEERVVRHNGSIFWGAITLTTAPGTDQRPRYLMGSLEDVTQRRERMERAAVVQRRLLPQHTLEIEGYDLAGACVPAEEVAGDFYDWYVPQPGVVDVTVADVMGKGIGAALVMATVRAGLRAAAPELGPAARLSRVVDALGLEAEDQELLVRVFHGRLEVATGRLRYVDAGHGYCAIRRPDGPLVPFTDRSVPLGVGRGDHFVEGITELQPGHCLIACTDGLLKTREHASTLAELASTLGESNDATEVANGLMSSTPLRPEDDATVLTLYRRDPSRAMPAPSPGAIQPVPSLLLEVACQEEDAAAQLDLIHEAMTRFWKRLAPPPDDAWRMRFELAVAEVAANVIEHARPTTMSFRLDAAPTSVTAEFTYEGPGWTDAHRSAQDNLLAERGRGLFLARTAVDEVGYQRDEGVVRWRLQKRV